MKMIYLDANATYGGIPENVLEGLLNQGTLFNPSAVHSAGQSSRAVLERCRVVLREFLSAPQGKSDVIFTSGATESNNMSLYLPFWETLSQGKPLSDLEYVVSNVEHPSVMEPAWRLQSLGAKVIFCSPTYESIQNALTPKTNFLSLMVANNETGVLYPVSSITAMARTLSPDIVVHSDAVQALGRIPLSFEELGVDLLTLSGHKLGALSGVGLLIARDTIRPFSTMLGGAQEKRWRAGTENVIGIASLEAACRYHMLYFDENVRKMKQMRDRLEDELCAVSGVSSPFQNKDRLPNTALLRFEGIRGSDLVVSLDLEGVCVSTGSACSSGKPLPSEVLQSMGMSIEEAGECVRMSLRPDFTEEERLQAVTSIRLCINRMTGDRQ